MTAKELLAACDRIDNAEPHCFADARTLAAWVREQLAARPVVPPEVHTVALAIGFSYGCMCPVCTMARFILSLTESKP
jgi:hypothetical protein